MINRLFFPMIMLWFTFGCEQKQITEVNLDEIIALRDEIKAEYAPDSRVAKFDIDISFEDGKLKVTGDTDQTKALATFMNKLIAQGIEIQDETLLLPDKTALKYAYAIVNNSVANLRTQPKHSAELATQAILGTVMKVLRVTAEWYLVQTPDDYIAWVDHGGVGLKTRFQIRDWQNNDKVIVTKTNSLVYKNVGLTSIVSEVILGNILERVLIKEGATLVRFPDGRKGYIDSSDVSDYTIWIDQLNPSSNLIEYYSRSLLGAPYLWGGTSVKGMDCSGFTKTVYFMNGLIIPRDASQQINAGKVVDENLSFEGLERGDLLFFGKPATDTSKQKTTHVGIWLGHSEFIHASKRVRISSIDSTKLNYDEFNKNRYLGSRRYLKNLEGNIMNLKAELTSQK